VPKFVRTKREVCTTTCVFESTYTSACENDVVDRYLRVAHSIFCSTLVAKLVCGGSSPFTLFLLFYKKIRANFQNSLFFKKNSVNFLPTILKIVIP